MVDIVEMSPLTLTDRRIYNQLLGNAWDKIAEPGQHTRRTGREPLGSSGSHHRAYDTNPIDQCMKAPGWPSAMNADAAFIAFCKTYAERHPLNS